MPTPTSEARAALDNFIKELALLDDGLNIDDFRSAQIAQAARTARRVKTYILVASIIFMILAVGSLFAQTFFSASGLSLSQNTSPSAIHNYDMASAAIWALALGGL